MFLIFFLCLTIIISTFSTSAYGAISGDANNDNKVDGLDYVIWLNNYNQTVSGSDNGDFTLDNKVDGLDYIIWLNNYNQTSVTPAPTVSVGFLPSFPQAEGFGATSKGGRGGTVIRITNLNDSGSGSFLACATASGPRYCIFDISGTITLSSKLTISNPFLTIAGESAPSPGITLKGAPLELKAGDIIIRHFRIRVGNQSLVNPLDLDGMSILGPDSKQVIIDHVSISWAVDENISTWYTGVSDITLSNSIISEALNSSTHPEDPHSKGFLIGDYSKNVALINTVFAHNFDRHPFIKGGTSSLILNNLFYNWGKPYGTRLGSNDSTAAGPILTNIQGNVYIKGTDTPPGSDAVSLATAASGSIWYIYDNKFEGIPGGLLSNIATPPVPTSLITPDSSANVESLLLKSSGARPKDRDAVDSRIISEIRSRSGRIIDNPNQVGGWPVLTQNLRTFPVPASPNGDDNGDGYTNLEELLHQYAAQIQ